MNNYGKARDRLKMCLNDLIRSLARYKEEDYSDAIFRLQLSVENACKSILSFLGVEFEKTHFPSVIIGKLISDKERLKRLNLNRDQIAHLTLIISYASSLEAQGSMPRYGWETEERIIVPSEIYTRDIASRIFELGLNCLGNVVKFFLEFKDLRSDLLTVVEQLRCIVEDVSRKFG